MPIIVNKEKIVQVMSFMHSIEIKTLKHPKAVPFSPIEVYMS